MSAPVPPPPADDQAARALRCQLDAENREIVALQQVDDQAATIAVLSARLAAVRALADYLETEARAGRVAPQLYAVGALIRARLDGPTEAPANDECGTCGHLRNSHDPAGVCRAAIRPAWAPDDECWCGRFVPVSVGPAEAAEPATTGHRVETWNDSTGYGWRCTCGTGGDGLTDRDECAAIAVRHESEAGAPEPGYQRIADAIQQLCEESAEVQIQLRPTKSGVTEWIGDQYLRLAQILDRAGLIDWAAFADESGSVSTTPDPDPMLTTAAVEPLKEALRDCLDNFPFEGGPDLWHVTDQLAFAVLNANWRPVGVSATPDPDALALIDELLRPWAYGYPVNPGYAGRAAQYVSVATLADWNRRRAALAGSTPKENDQ